MNRYSDFFTDLVSVCAAHEKDIFAVLGDEVCTEDFLRFLYDLYKKGYELGEADARPYGVYGSDPEEAEKEWDKNASKEQELMDEWGLSMEWNFDGSVLFNMQHHKPSGMDKTFRWLAWEAFWDNPNEMMMDTINDMQRELLEV